MGPLVGGALQLQDDGERLRLEERLTSDAVVRQMVLDKVAAVCTVRSR